MASINASVLLIALPDIFRGIGLNPLRAGNSSLLLWLIMGYMVVTAVLVVSFGRLGDMYGRVRIYNLGFAVSTLFSVGYQDPRQREIRKSRTARGQAQTAAAACRSTRSASPSACSTSVQRPRIAILNSSTRWHVAVCNGGRLWRGTMPTRSLTLGPWSRNPCMIMADRPTLPDVTPQAAHQA